MTLSVFINGRIIQTKNVSLTCYDNKKIKKDIANLKSVYGALVSSAINLNENIDTNESIEVLKNENYILNKFTLNSPAILNREFIINLEHSILKIKTYEPL